MSRFSQIVRSSLGFTGALALLFLRSPNGLLHPVFAAEDGQTLYIATYFSSPLAGLLTPIAGYLQVIARAAAYVERLVPVAQAPFIADLLSLSVVAAIACYIASSRMAILIPNLRLRLLLAVLLLVLPASQEVFGSIHDLQWYLAIWLLLVALASPARSKAAAWVERIVLAAVALTGPFSIMLAPLFVLRAWHERNRNSVIAALIVSVGAIIQLIVTLNGGRISQGSYPLFQWIGIAATRMVAQPILGTGVLVLIEKSSWVFPLAILGAGTLALCIITAASRLPRFPTLAAFWAGGSIAVSGVLSNNITPGGTLLNPWEGMRYFFVLGAVIAVVLVCGSLVRGPGKMRQNLAIAGTLLLLIGICCDFFMPRAPETEWATKSACIGGVTPCVVPLGATPSIWDIYWPGSEGVYNPYPTYSASP